MTLREQILNSPETLSDFAWAAEQRFREAETLLSGGQITGAVYLFGLAAEMWLKLACFRYHGLGPSAPVAGQFGPAKTWMQAHAPGISPESYHSLEFWSEYLLRTRAAAGAALSGRLAGELRHHVANRLFWDWKIELRYRLIALTEQHAWRVYNDTVWLRQTWNQLWR